MYHSAHTYAILARLMRLGSSDLSSVDVHAPCTSTLPGVMCRSTMHGAPCNAYIYIVLALCNAVEGGWSSVALSEWSPYPSCFECEYVRDKEKWSPWSSGRHIRVVSMVEWSPYQSGRHIRMVAISEWSPYQSGRHIRVVAISEWSPLQVLL